MPPLETFLYAFAGGLFPALIWLWFFLRQDKQCPEPKGLILLSFISGMAVVFMALFVEKYVANYFEEGTFLTVVWAATEEILKWLVAALVVLWRRAVNEPIDPIVYMITVALGFSALETGLFLLAPISDGNFAAGIITSNLRFLGAALLHVVCSAMIGVALAFAFYRSYWQKVLFLFIGLFTAITLHSWFNLSIIDKGGNAVLFVFFCVWIGVIVLLLLFERVKRIHKKIIKPLYSRNYHGTK